MNMPTDQDFRHYAEERSKPKRDWDSEIEKSLQEAEARGDFDQLPGRGKPLKWDGDHDDENWLANRVLKNAGYRPAWIDDDRAIRADREALARLLDEFLAWHHAAAAEISDLPADAARARQAEIDAARSRRIATYRERAGKLNRLIDSFNLTVPIPGKEHFRVRVDAEIAAFEARLG